MSITLLSCVQLNTNIISYMYITAAHKLLFLQILFGIRCTLNFVKLSCSVLTLFVRSDR